MISTRHYFGWLWGITIFAWGLRLFLVASTVGLSSPLDANDGSDESDYETFAAQLASGNGYVLDDGTPSARRAPGTSLFLLPVYLLLGRNLVAARLWMTLLSALNCAAVAWVLRRHCGSLAALLSAAAVAVNPGMFYYSIHLWSETPYVLIMTLTAGCVLQAIETSTRRWTWLAGLGWGTVVLLRPQIIFIGPCVLFAGFWLRSSDRRIWLRELMVEAVIALGLITPWVVRNQLVLGSPTVATLVGGCTFWGAHNSETFDNPKYSGLWRMYLEDPTSIVPLTGTEPEKDRQAWANGYRFLKTRLSDVPKIVCWKLYRLVTPFEETTNRTVYWTFAMAWIISLPLVLLGITGLKQRDPALFAWFLLHIGAVVLSSIIFYGAARFRHSIEPFLMMSAAIGLLKLRELCWKHKACLHADAQLLRQSLPKIESMRDARSDIQHHNT